MKNLCEKHKCTYVYITEYCLYYQAFLVNYFGMIQTISIGNQKNY